MSKLSALRSYNIGLHSAILDPVHVRAMGQAVWLFMWYVHRQTDFDGKVAGGTPVTWEMLHRILGASRATLQRWQKALLGENDERRTYIAVEHGGRGFYVTVLKQKKWSDRARPPRHRPLPPPGSYPQGSHKGSQK